MSYLFDRDETEDPERAISLTLQILGGARVAQVLPELFAVWGAQRRRFIAEELVLLEYVECFDALHAQKLIDPDFVVEQFLDERVSSRALGWMLGPFTEWLQTHRATRDKLFAGLAAEEDTGTLFELARACGISRRAHAHLTDWHSNSADDVVDALEAAAEFVDADA